MRCFRRVIRIRAEESPNVDLALREIAAGRPPSHTIVLPGVLPYADYVKRRAAWDPVKQCVSLDGLFWEGAEVMLFPAALLARCNHLADELPRGRRARAIGVDPAEGGDCTAMAAADEKGIIELVSKRTPDTDVIPGEVIAFGKRHGAPPENWLLDRGGGGKQHADRLRKRGFLVRTVGFGEGVSLEPRRGLFPLIQRKDVREERYAYVNRRAEMYGDLSVRMEEGFGIPAEYAELLRQLALMPRLYDREGRLRMLPKNRATEQSHERTLVELLGRSPDEADAVVLAVHGMKQHRQVVVGAIR